MVSFKSVLIAALAVTSASAHPSRFGRRHNGHGHGGRPSVPAPIRFQNSTIPAVESSTTVSSSSAVLSTGIPDVVTSAPVVSSTPLDPVIVTETTTTEIYTTVTVSYTLGNGKVVTTAFSKVRQPGPSTTSSTQQTVTVIPVATPEELDETAAAASPTAAPTVSTIEPVEEIFTTSTSTTTVYTTVYRTKSPSTPSAAAATPGFDGLVNDFITKFPQVGFGSASSLIASACSKISPATVTVGVPAATVTETVEVAAATVTSVSVSVSYVTVGASATGAPVVPAPSSPVDFETILPTETASPDTEEAPVPTTEPATSTETVAPVPTQIPPFANNTVPLFPNATNPETVTRITATVVPIAPTATGTF